MVTNSFTKSLTITKIKRKMPVVAKYNDSAGSSTPALFLGSSTRNIVKQRK